MKSFLQFITEGQQEFGTTIALVGGSFKPPHAGHWDMVQKYADKADKVVVLISDPKSAKSVRKTSLGTIITPDMSKKIWDLYISRYGLNGKVEAIVSPEPSPITALYKYIDANLKDVNVIFGASTKGDDYKRFLTAPKYYADNENIHVLDPKANAVSPFSVNGIDISATDIRNNIDKPEVIKPMLPDKLTDSDVQKVIKILGTGHQVESVATRSSLDPLDETESVHLLVNDDLLKTSRVAAYNVGQTLPSDEKSAKEIPYNPKKFPQKAVDIIFPVQDLIVEVFLDTESKKWDSDLVFKNQHLKLSPEQMGEFFNSEFYQKLSNKLQKSWPLSDELYGSLFEAIQAKEMKVGPDNTLEEANDEEMRNKDVDGDNQRDYTASGGKIVSFSDGQVTMKNARFFCWPDLKKVDKWSTWKDWKKIKPLCRIRFYHGNIPYGISLSTIGDDYQNRGFRGYSLDPNLPPVQWLTHEENIAVMKLSIVNKFLKHCIAKIQKYVDMDPNDIYEKINAPDKITVKEIELTQSKIRKTLNEIVKNHQIDSFKWN